ncbi:MAG: 2-oxoacid:acceptor oxidoreductase family protein [Bacteriovoracaceae bacterium]|nr:2-oxoacid:acceptor oxidoreductase family protein [Bacteriovoracaceae bacterium]
MTVKILNGNELLIQGGLEAGFHLYTGYPGSPLADFFNILYERKDELHGKGIRVVIANSEANAAAMASGAKMAGQNVLVAMKSMGLHVASDALSVGNFANPGLKDSEGEKPGVVIAVGDDPWSISTSTPADSRYLYKHLHIPFLEPSTPQELKDWMKVALELSRESSIYVGILLTTFMAEGGGRVEISEEKKIDHSLVTLDPSKFNLAENVMVPPNSLGADIRMLQERFPKFLEALESKNLDKTFGNPQSKIGVVSSGAVFETLKQELESTGLLSQVHLYKAAGGYVLNAKALKSFLSSHERVLVVEEKRGFLEAELNDLCAKIGIHPIIWGKNFADKPGFPAFGGLNNELVRKGLRDSLGAWGLDVTGAMSFVPTKLNLTVPRRLPTFCPGCPHRETLSIMKEIRSDLAQKNINLVSHGDVGCYSLSFLEPFKEMHDLSAMGQGGSLGAGTDLFTNNPSVVLMGDSTFFHSGMTSISNSVQMGHNITYILLDNDNTAMTGHQVTPRSGQSVEGVVRPRQSMLDVARSLRVSEAIEVNPSDRFFYKNLLTDYINKPGVKVIVSNKECGLTFHGRVKREERAIFKDGGTQSSKSFYQINTLACEDCRVCVEMTGCPGLSQTEDAYGTKVMIDPQICVSDSYCTKLKACPSFELVEVSDYHPTKYQEHKVDSELNEMRLPEVKFDLDSIAHGKDWRSIVIGVGGSGVTTISRVIAEAAQDMGGRDDLDFKFVDQKGLAQRNGSVTSHLALFSKKHSHGQIVPEATAQVVVSPDLFEGARAIHFLSDTGYLIVDEDFQVPLSVMLDDGRSAPVMTSSDILEELKAKLGERLISGPFKKLCYERFQKPVYASSMLLGVMFQKGLLPFSEANMIKAITSSIPKSEVSANLTAFKWGRSWILDSSSIKVKTEFDTIPLMLESVRQVAYPWQNPQRFVNLFNHYKNLGYSLASFVKEEYWAQYVHDLIVFDQGRGLNAFFEDIRLIIAMNLNDELKAMAIRAVAKTYWVKDEVFVSHLMVSPLKNHRDLVRYGRLGTGYEVKRMNRPAFEIFGKTVEFDFSPKDWMLKIMRNLRLLRILMPKWHELEREISRKIRLAVLEQLPGKESSEQRAFLKDLENIKGYRTVRYEKAKKLLG